MSEELKVSGTIKVILPIQSGTSKAGRAWEKLDFVIETGGEYSNDIAFTLFGDKVNLIEGMGEGQHVDVSFNIQSREYDGRWFSNVNAWKVVGTGTSATYTGAPMDNGSAPQTTAATNDDGTPSDLPF